jgi:protein O-GlcNAc transferase
VKQNFDIVQSLQIASKHHRNGRLAEAERIYVRILRKNPKQPDALHQLGLLANEKGDPALAAELISRAILVKPNSAEYYDNLGDAFTNLGKFNESIMARQKAVSLDNKFFRAYFFLGNLLGLMARYDEAISAFHAAHKLKPNDAETLHKLGFAYFSAYMLDESFAAYNQAAALQPNSAAIKMNQGHSWIACGMHKKGMQCFNDAISQGPPVPEYLSARIFAMHYDAAHGPAELLNTARQWDELVALPLRPTHRKHTNDRTPNRKLRIGYVSPDFRHHVVGQSIERLLRHHNKDQFEIYLYSNTRQTDDVTGKLRAHAHAWREIYRVSDEKSVEMIRADRIDILIDLALHSFGSRLGIFARRPAPVQITYLGYCSTTGLSAMDYRLSDTHVDPPDVEPSDYSERTLRLPRTHLYYQPLNETPDVASLPALAGETITFGCMNKFPKSSSAALDLWARILRESPKSRLILHALPGQYLEEVRAHFEQNGVSSQRVEFVGRQNWAQYIQTFSRIDIALDPFPYNGGITSCDAMWMGAPVITLAGRTAVGRVGRSILSNMGLPDLIANSPDEYVRMAIYLSNNINRLSTLRAELRSRLQNSPLHDAKGLMNDIEHALRQAWQNYCEAQS